MQRLKNPATGCAAQDLLRQSESWPENPGQDCKLSGLKGCSFPTSVTPVPFSPKKDLEYLRNCRDPIDRSTHQTKWWSGQVSDTAIPFWYPSNKHLKHNQPFSFLIYTNLQHLLPPASCFEAKEPEDSPSKQHPAPARPWCRSPRPCPGPAKAKGGMGPSVGFPGGEGRSMFGWLIYEGKPLKK